MKLVKTVVALIALASINSVAFASGVNVQINGPVGNVNVVKGYHPAVVPAPVVVAPVVAYPAVVGYPAVGAVLVR